MRKLGFTAISIAALVTSMHAPAATLMVDGTGELTGATGVLVAGTSYNVSFVEGTCVDVFGGCDETSDFAFTDSSSAQAAAFALLNQVFLDGADGQFDSNPNLTLGCESTEQCLAMIPYATAAGSFSSQSASNGTSLIDPAINHTVAVALDTASADRQVFALFSVPSVPEPATWVMMLLGFGAAGFALRRQKKAASHLNLA